MVTKQLVPMINEILKQMAKTKGFNRIAAPVEVIDANMDGCLKFKCVIDDTLVNHYGTIHGGFTSFLVDYTTSTCVAVVNNRNSGVSIDLHVRYLNSAKIGDTIIAETKCTKLGKRLAFSEFKMKNSDGKLLATATHTKFVG